MKITIRHSRLTRILESATDKSGESRFKDIDKVRFNADGSAEATNGRVYVAVYNHHTTWETQDGQGNPIPDHFYVQFNKKSYIPITKQSRTDCPAEVINWENDDVPNKYIRWGRTHSFFVKMPNTWETQWLENSLRIIPKYDTEKIPSILTCFTPWNKDIIEVVQEVEMTIENSKKELEADDTPIVWAGAPDKPGILLHGIPSLLVVGMPLRYKDLKENYNWETSEAWETYKTIQPNLPNNLIQEES